MRVLMQSDDPTSTRTSTLIRRKPPYFRPSLVRGCSAEVLFVQRLLATYFAEAVRPAARPLPPAEVRALDALLSRRQQLLEVQVMESNRLGACADPTVRAGLERHRAWLKAEIADADRLLAEAVKASPAWREKDELLRSIPGLGPVSSLTLLAALPELGTLDGGKLSALVGLAPFADDSGTRRGGRHVRGGRAAVRRVLYLAA